MLTAETAATISRCILDARGREICGLLLIDRTGKQSFRSVSNYAGAADAFLISEAELRMMSRYAERTGLRIGAFIHSHRYGLELSRDDLLSFRTSEIAWIVVVLRPSGLAFKVHETGH